MAEPMERTGRGERLMRAMFSDEAIAQAAALEKSLEPDPDADPITRIDQEWIQESKKYVALDSSGVIAPPNRQRLIAIIAVAALLGPGLVALSLAVGNGGLLCFGGFFSVFFLLPLLLALRTANVYYAAAAAYRERRAAAVAALGRPAADQPLPIIDAPVRLSKTVLPLDQAITQLYDAYAFSRIGAEEYQRNQALLLAEAPAQERAFYQEWMALEHAWAVQRRKLAVKRSDRSDQHVPPSASRARKSAMVGVIGPLVITAVLAVQGVSLIFALGGVLIGGLILIEAWSTYQKAGRYELAQAEYHRRREELLASRRWQQRSAG